MYYIQHKNLRIEAGRSAQILSISAICDGYALEATEIKDYLKTNSLEKEAVLVIKYSVLDCVQCDLEILNQVNRYFGNTVNNPKIVFLAEGFRTKEEFEYGTTLYIEKKAITPLDSFSSPVLFIYKDNTIFHTYLPVLKYRDELIEYLTLMDYRYAINASLPEGNK